nr:hypothetical protein [Candidatus Sigynarchaeum springense]
MPDRASPRKILADHPKRVSGIHSDADFLYTWGPGYVAEGNSYPTGTVFIYNKQKNFKLDGMIVGFSQDIYCAISTDDHIIVGGGGGKDLTGYRYSVLRLYNKETQLLEQDWGGDEYRVTSLFADEKYVYAGTSNSTLLVHDKATMREIKSIYHFVDQSPGTHIASDKSRLYCGAGNGTVKAWSKETWTPGPSLESGGGMITHVIARDGRVFAADESGNVIAWNAGDLVATLCIHACDGPVRGMTLSGQHVFIGDASGTISGWNTSDFQKVLSFEGGKVAISVLHADDVHIYSGCDDGAVLVWDVAEIIGRKKKVRNRYAGR